MPKPLLDAEKTREQLRKLIGLQTVKGLNLGRPGVCYRTLKAIQAGIVAWELDTSDGEGRLTDEERQGLVRKIYLELASAGLQASRQEEGARKSPRR